MILYKALKAYLLGFYTLIFEIIQEDPACTHEILKGVLGFRSCVDISSVGVAGLPFSGSAGN